MNPQELPTNRERIQSEDVFVTIVTDQEGVVWKKLALSLYASIDRTALRVQIALPA